MVNSKSGSIRQTLGLRKKRLRDILSAAKPSIEHKISFDEEPKEDVIVETETIISRLSTAIDILRETDKQWQDLIQSLPTDEIKDEEDLYERVAISEGGHINLLDDAREGLGLLRMQLDRLRSSAAMQHNSTPTQLNTFQAHSRATRKSAKLPKLTLPFFNGDPLTWSQFYSIFRTNIDDSELDGAEKLTYLRGQLRGTALEAIEGLQINDEGYAMAMDILKQRFERTPEQLVSSLYSQLKRLPKSSGRVEDLQQTYDECEKIFRQLRSVGEDIDSNRSLTMDVWSKYPVSVVKELSRRKMASTHSKLSDVQVALKDYIDESGDLRDMIGDLEPFGKESTGSSTSNKPHQRENYAQRNLTVPINSALTSLEKPAVGTLHQISSSAKPKFPCCFCKEIHFNSECPNYLSRQQRLMRLCEINRCQRCLGNRHATAICDAGNDRVRCYYCKTNGEHISALCPNQFPDVEKKTSAEFSKQSYQPSSGQSPRPVPNNDALNEPKSSSNTSCGLSFDEQSLLSTAVATVTDPQTGRRERAKIILDSGSHRSYITESLSKRLGLYRSKDETLNVAVFGSNRSLTVTSSQVEIQVTLRNGSSVPLALHTTPMITSCSLSMNGLPETIQQFMESIKDAMADDGSVDGPPDILIGSDYFWEFVSGTLMKTDDGIFVIPSSLGLILGGRFKGDSGTRRCEQPVLLCLTERTASTNYDRGLTLISTECKSQPAIPDVDDFWSLEKIGICDSPADNDDELALKSFNETVYQENKRYYVQWPWMEDKCALPPNYQLAMGRLRSLAKRLGDSGTNLADEYNEVINTQVKLGIIEKVPQDEINSTKTLVHYLPHHPVVKSDKATTKFRIVYDASAKCRKDQSSLNECMFRGPVLLPDLCSILMRFRMHKIGITSDIEKAFLQVGLAPSQRDVTRFLWFNQPRKPALNDISVFRFARVPFGVISSPFLLGATIKFHLNSIRTETANIIADSIYVDNVITGVDDHESAKKFYDEAKDIFDQASMNLRQWNSNSHVLSYHIPSEDHEAKVITNILGLKWNTESDMIRIKDNWKHRRTCRTKREVLQATAAIYDPLGLFQPCTLRLKLFLRELWNSKTEWDEVIDVRFQQQWSLLHEEIFPIFDVHLPRYIPNSHKTSLVVFSDASTCAYAVVAYLRTPTSQGSWQSHLVFSKSRLAPNSTTKDSPPISIPKLELLGLTIAARATEFIRNSLHMSNMKSYLFCDSICTLRWLRSVKPLPVFVSNRVREIKSLTHVEFRHVNSEDNPADVCTRGASGQMLSEETLWWHGPPWLEKDASTWQTESNFGALTDDDIADKANAAAPPVFHSLVAGEDADCRHQKDSTLLRINPNEYSAFSRLIRVTCWVRRFIKMMVFDRMKLDDQDRHVVFRQWIKDVANGPFITSSELNQTKMIYIKRIQNYAFEDVFRVIQTNKPHHLVQQLNLQIDGDGLLRSHSRMKFAEISDDAKTPILLPHDDHITKLIVSDIHQNLLHPGVNHTLSQIRRIYWIPRGRNCVKKIITNCQVCRKLKGPPYALPTMPHWPKERVSRAAPFQFSGVDYFGPINVLLNDAPQKMWVCLFTCLTVRAVHLEPVSSCTAEAFINALSRFMSRRGAPEQLLSDNAPQFRLAKTLFDRSWHKVFIDTSVQTYISDKGIRWVFTTELAPWMGGAYERMVGLVKNCYKSAVGRKLLKYEEFITLIAEVEAIVNSRPITYVYTDADSGLPLRPVDFLAERPTGTPSIESNLRPEGGDASKNLVRYWKSKQRRLDAIWKQWHTDYLLSLRERGSRAHKSGRSDIKCAPGENELVIVKNDDTPRGTWKMARITRMIPGADGSIRSAELLLPNKQLIRRPINHLYRLEIPSPDENNTVAEKEPNDGESNPEDDPFEGFTEDEVRAAESRTASLISNLLNRENGYLPSCIQMRLNAGLSGTTSNVCFTSI